MIWSWKVQKQYTLLMEPLTYWTCKQRVEYKKGLLQKNQTEFTVLVTADMSVPVFHTIRVFNSLSYHTSAVHTAVARSLYANAFAFWEMLFCWNGVMQEKPVAIFHQPVTQAVCVNNIFMQEIFHTDQVKKARSMSHHWPLLCFFQTRAIYAWSGSSDALWCHRQEPLSWIRWSVYSHEIDKPSAFYLYVVIFL